MPALAPPPIAGQGARPEDLTALVLRTNPELAAVRVRLAAAGRRRDGAGAPPPLALSGEVEDVPDGWDVTGATLRLEGGRELLTGGRAAAARALAAAEVSRVEAELEVARQRLAGEAYRTAWRVLGSQAMTRRLSTQDSLLAEAEQALTARFALGGARYVDVLRVRTERLRVRNDVASAVASHRASRALLLGLVGPDSGAEADRILASMDADSMASTAPPPAPPLDSLISASGVLRVAEMRRGIRDAELTVARASTRSRVGVSAGVQRAIGERTSGFGPVLVVSATLPFTSSRSNQSVLAAAELELASEGEAVASVRTRIRAALVAALDRYDAALARLQAYDDALLQGARAERESAVAAFRSGELSLLELLDFEQALTRAETDRLRARMDAADAYANLIAAGSTLPDAAGQEERP